MGNNFTIGNLPNKQMPRGCCAPAPYISLSNEVKNRLPQGQQLTKDVALDILKSIRWEAKVKSFFTSPWLLLPSITAVVVGCALVPPISIPLMAISMAVSIFAFMCLGITFSLTIDGSLGLLSDTYAELAEEADKTITQLERASPRRIFAQ